MSTVRVLDCTLRDGGYINGWRFGQKSIHGIISNLVNASVDIIECGFLRRTEFNQDCSVFSSMNDLEMIIYPKSENIMYAIMIEHHNNVYDLIPPNNGKGADIIRVTFRINEWNDVKNHIKGIMDKGYKVCIQPVGTTNYSDEALINLLKDVNEIHPYAFYLVDTLGVMYTYDMSRFFYLIDNNLSSNIVLGFHSHNNLQMSFSNAQELIRLANNRNVIIDSSCYGMGRGVGNLPTELLIDYINHIIKPRYTLSPVLNIIDRYLMPIYAEHRWGYDLPYFLSATSKCHPNYASHLINKETLDIDKIEKLISLIPYDERKEYNEKLIEELYNEMQSSEIDDEESYNRLKNIIGKKEVLIIGSGYSVIKQRNKIDSISDGKFIISVNFSMNDYPNSALFVSNSKRLTDISENKNRYIISTSNLSVESSLVFDYSSLLGEGEAGDNAGAMLIRILKKVDVKKIYIAGFDGFDVNASANYAINEFKKPLDSDAIMKKNNSIGRQLKQALQGMTYEFITATRYDI